MSIENMIEAAFDIAECAYAPYSKFKVGACIKTANGKLYTGCNVENASYGLSTCAEASAVIEMLCHKEQAIAKIVIVGLDCDDYISPCGACRQRIREFAPLDTPIHMAKSTTDYITHTLEALLPLSFGPQFLENK